MYTRSSSLTLLYSILFALLNCCIWCVCKREELALWWETKRLVLCVNVKTYKTASSIFSDSSTNIQNPDMMMTRTMMMMMVMVLNTEGVENGWIVDITMIWNTISSLCLRSVAAKTLPWFDLSRYVPFGVWKAYFNLAVK